MATKDPVITFKELQEELSKLTEFAAKASYQIENLEKVFGKNDKKVKDLKVLYGALKDAILECTDELSKYERGRGESAKQQKTFDKQTQESYKVTLDKLKGMNTETSKFGKLLKDAADEAKKLSNATKNVTSPTKDPDTTPPGEQSKLDTPPDPKNWKEWNAEVAKAIAYIDEIRIKTKGLSDDQKKQLSDAVDDIRRHDTYVKEHLESERNLVREDHDLLVSKQQVAAAIKTEISEREKLNNARDREIKKLDDFVIKNEEVIRSNEALSQAAAMLRKQLQGVSDSAGLKEAHESLLFYQKTVKETTNISKAAAKESKALALAQASEIATLATTIRTKILDGLYNFALQQIRQVVEATKELDARLVEIRKVTDFSDNELKDFVSNIKEIGNATATTTSALLDASAVFARSGYTREQIEMLTEEAAVLRNVSDGITDMGKSAEILISIMKAYHVSAEEARSITDQLNAISNNAAISFDDLADGLSRVGSVFASQNTSIGELSAMLTGANEILQNIEKTSNGLKTISQRLRGIDAEMSGDVLGTAKLQGLFTSITEQYGDVVRITDEATGQLRGTYDILKDLAGVWGSLTSNEQQLLGEKIAGKNQITVLQALLNNWEGVEKAIKNVDAASGSAAREQQAYINSLTGSVNQLKAALQNMYQGAIDSSLLSGIVQALTTVVKLIDKIGIGAIAAGAGVAGIAGKVNFMRDNFKSTLTTLSDIIGSKGLSGVFKSAKEINEQVNKTLESVESIGGLSADELKQAKRLVDLAAQGNLKFTDRMALSRLTEQSEDKQLKILGEEIAAQQTLNSLKSIGLSIGIALGTLFASKFIAWLSETIEKEKVAVQTAMEGLEDVRSELQQTQDQIDEIYKTIRENGGQVTQSELANLEKLKLKMLELKQLEKERLQETADAVNRKTSGVNDESGQRLATVYQYIDEKTQQTITVADNAIKSFLDENGKLIESKAEEALSYLSNHNIEALQEVRDFADEDGQIILEAYENLEEVVSEYYAKIEAEQERVLTQGVSAETITAAFKDIFADVEGALAEDGGLNWNAILGMSDMDVISKLAEKLGVSFDILRTRLEELNDTNVQLWQKQYTDIANVERKLTEYNSLYTMAVNGLSNNDLLTIIDNWEKYADVLDVENGHLVISKDLIVAKAKATIEAAKAELITERDKLDGYIAMVEFELELRKATNASAKDRIAASNDVVKAKAYELAMNNALIKSEKGVETGLNAVATQAAAFARISASASHSTAELETALANMKQRYADLNAQIEALNNIDIEGLMKKAAAAASKGSKSAKSATKAVNELEEALKRLKDVLSALEQQMSDTTDVYEQVQQAMKDIVDAEIEALENENDVLDENMDYYRARIKLIVEAYEEQIAAIKAEQEAAEDANEAQQQALEDLIDALEEETKAYEKQNKAEQDAIDAQIDALEAQKDAIDDVNNAHEKELEMQQLLLDIEKARLAAEKAKDAYEQAKQNKTVRTYDAERGWVWSANQAEVESAYNEYAAAQKKYEDLLAEYADKQAEAEREAQKAAIQEQIDALKEQKEALQELLEETKENADAQKDAWKDAIDALKEEKEAITDGYEAQIDAIEQQISQLENIEDNVERAVDKYMNDQGVMDWVEAYLNASEEEREAMEGQLGDLWLQDRQRQEENAAQIEELNQLLTDIDEMLKTTTEVLESENIKAWLEAFKNGDFGEREDMIGEMRDAYIEFYTQQQDEMRRIREQIAQIEGTINYTNLLLENWGTGEHYTPIHQYANGGVVDSGLLKDTGMLSNSVKVHGSPSKPELILNGRQQANLLYRLARQNPVATSNNNAYSTQSMYIANLTITADSQDTLHGLLLEARQLASIN